MSSSINSATPTRTWTGYRPSQATLVACAVGMTLLVLFIVSWASYRNQPQRVAWSDYMQWPQLLALGLLWSLICALTYWLVRLWHEELPSENGSIEAAWQAGLKTLKARGQKIDQVPLFLVLGNLDRAHQQRLFELAGIALEHELVPAQADSPLHWAFTDQGVWLLVHGAGTYSSLSKRLAMLPVDRSAIEHASMFAARLTNVPEAFSAFALHPTTKLKQSHRDHDHLHVPSSQQSCDPESSQTEFETGLQARGVNSASIFACASNVATASASEDDASIQTADSICRPAGTVSPSETVAFALEGLEELVEAASQAESTVAELETGQNRTDADALTSSQPRSTESAWRTEMAFQTSHSPSAMSSTELTNAQQALQEICRRLRSQRRSIAPANGVVALVHSQQLMSGPLQAGELGISLRRDLQIIQEQCHLHMPTTLLVDGLETLTGARELVRRSGPDEAKNAGMGTAYPIRYLPEKHLVSHACSLAVGQVEARVYRHLHPTDGLMRVGNDLLFRLLVTCRSRLLPALQSFTGEAVGLTSPAEDTSEPGLFAGIHLIASGSKVTEQAWVRSALSHIVQSQNYLRWTSQRLRSERQLQFVTTCLKACGVILAITLGAVLIGAWR